MARQLHRAKSRDVDGLTPTQQTEFEALRALAAETAKHKLPGATSDHRHMYDEFGLPNASRKKPCPGN